MYVYVLYIYVYVHMYICVVHICIHVSMHDGLTTHTGDLAEAGVLRR